MTLMEKIGKYVEFEEKINELEDNINYIKNNAKRRKAEKEANELYDMCEGLLQEIRKKIDELAHEGILRLQIILNDNIRSLSESKDKIVTSLEKPDVDSDILLENEKIVKYENRIYSYEQILDYVNSKNNVKRI